MSNPNNCATCDYKLNPDGGWCYMFRHEPKGVCEKHTPPRKPLTDDEIHDIYDEVAKREPYGMAVTRRNIARAIEAAHGITGEQK